MLLRSLLFLSLLPALAAAACSKDPPAAASDKASANDMPLAHITGDNYQVDTSSTCAGGECTATIRLEATHEYHLNEAYPYKFKANPSDGVVFEGNDGSDVYSKDAFAKQSEKVGAMTVKLKPKGKTTVTGVFKMSVCSAANCELEQPAVAIDVTP